MFKIKIIKKLSLLVLRIFQENDTSNICVQISQEKNQKLVDIMFCKITNKGQIIV